MPSGCSRLSINISPNAMNSTLANNATTLQGWTQSPNGRGSLDIIWSSAITVSLCAWSALCVNVSAPGDTFFRRNVLRKIEVACICLVCPDFLVYIAIGQWESAHRSVKRFHGLGYREWSLKHAFFADMGGIEIKTREGRQWPLDANQLAYLIEHGFIPPAVAQDKVVVDKRVIEDKNKADLFVRFITLVQTLWFVLNCIGRAAQGLAVTTMEITVLSFIVTTFGVLFFWAHKPADVTTAIEIDINYTVEDIQSRTNPAPYGWYRTPLDAVDAELSNFTLAWIWYRNFFTTLLPFKFIPQPKHGSIDRRGNTIISTVHLPYLLIPGLIGAASWGMNFLAWNARFPSHTEKTMWRISSVCLGLALCAGFFYEIVILLYLKDLRRDTCEEFAAYTHSRNAHPSLESQEDTFDLLPLHLSSSSSSSNQKTHQQPQKPLPKPPHDQKTMLNFLRNPTRRNPHPSLTMPLRIVIPMLICSSVYGAARVYILLEDLLAFRALPGSAYESVQWWAGGLPHV